MRRGDRINIRRFVSCTFTDSRCLWEKRILGERSFGAVELAKIKFLRGGRYFVVTEHCQMLLHIFKYDDIHDSRSIMSSSRYEIQGVPSALQFFAPDKLLVSAGSVMF